MTYEQALEVKQILMDCRGTIPATHVDRVYHYYKTFINPSAGGKPCTCSPRYWNEFLIALRDKVEATLASYEGTQEKQEIPSAS
jgi:hypothetical protein